MIKAVIFDVDGVLVDSKEANVSLFQTLLKDAGFPEPGREAILECFHIPLIPTLERLTGTSNPVVIDKIVEKLNQPGFDHQPAAELFSFPEELEEILNSLHKKYKLGIATSRLRSGMDHVFSLRQIEHLFDAIVTFDDYQNPKPDPEPLLLAAKKLNVNPEEAIYIGDGSSDIEAAKSAGMKSVHVSRTPHPDSHQAVEEFNQLKEAIESLL